MSQSMQPGKDIKQAYKSDDIATASLIMVYVLLSKRKVQDKTLYNQYLLDMVEILWFKDNRYRDSKEFSVTLNNSVIVSF